MKPFHVKRGDEVVVISGAEKGKRGKIIQVLRKKQRVVIEGVNLRKKHVRKSQQYPEGGIIEREGSIHISNVMLASKYDERMARRQAAASRS
ncbi:MAG: 50S ribosomal protein L24 [Verrucomicrobia bacterium]|nr:MAG: 50S ribosomal protein L24 [Verrucomicrobiota bacterium]